MSVLTNKASLESDKQISGNPDGRGDAVYAAPTARPIKDHETYRCRDQRIHDGDERTGIRHCLGIARYDRLLRQKKAGQCCKRLTAPYPSETPGSYRRSAQEQG